MPRFAPQHHGIVVSFEGRMFVGPFVIFGFVDGNCFSFFVDLLERVGEVVEFVPVVVVASFFFYAKIFCL